MGYGAILGKSSTTWTNDQIMSNTTAALFGLGADAVPDDMLNALAHTGDLHVWKRRNMSYACADGSSRSETYNSTVMSRWKFGTGVSCDPKTGKNIQLTGVFTPEHPPTKTHIDYWSNLINKGLYGEYDNSGEITRGIEITGSTDTYITTRVAVITSVFTVLSTDYPVSPNRNAYQEGDNSQPAGYTLGDVQNGQFKLTTDSDLYSPSILYSYGSSVYVGEDGSLSLSSPDGSVSATREQYEYNLLPVLKGKFIQANTPGSNNWIGDFQVGKIFFIPETATLDKLSNGTPFFSQIQTVTGYPAIPADTTIEYMSQLGDKARIVTGSYVGTGKYGISNPNTLEFDKRPKIVFIVSESAGFSSPLVYGQGGYGYYPNVFSDLNATWGDKSISWYSDANEYNQLNGRNIPYSYLAIL